MAERTEENPTKAVLSPEELAAFLGCGRTFTYRLIAQGPEGGGIRSFKIGRLRKVLRADAEAFIERQLKGPAE